MQSLIQCLASFPQTVGVRFAPREWRGLRSRLPGQEEWSDAPHHGREERRLRCCLGLGRNRAVPGQGCPEHPGQESWMRGCKAFWKDFLLMQPAEVHLLRIPVKSAPAGKALSNLCVRSPCAEKELDARKRRLAQVYNQLVVAPNAELSISR